jgi:hypothetical protein
VLSNSPADRLRVSPGLLDHTIRNFGRLETDDLLSSGSKTDVKTIPARSPGRRQDLERLLSPVGDKSSSNTFGGFRRILLLISACAFSGESFDVRSKFRFLKRRHPPRASCEPLSSSRFLSDAYFSIVNTTNGPGTYATGPIGLRGAVAFSGTFSTVAVKSFPVFESSASVFAPRIVFALSTML